jgi:hypothetical protein
MSDPKPESRAVLQERILRVEQRNDQLEREMREFKSQRDIARQRAEDAQNTVAMKDMQIAGLLKMVHRYEGAIAIMSSSAFDNLARIDNPSAD